MTDVLIAGGAVMGASVAFWLTRMQPGLSVTVIEPDPSYATSSTALSVASIRQQFTNPVNVQISRFGIEFIRDFARYIGPAGDVPDLGFRENGYLFLTGTETGAAQLHDLADMQRSLGAATVIWGPAELRQRYPWMNTDDVTAASFGLRDEGWFDNMGLLSGLKNAARAAGAVFRKDRVLRLDPGADGRIATALLEFGRNDPGRCLCQRRRAALRSTDGRAGHAPAGSAAQTHGFRDRYTQCPPPGCAADHRSFRHLCAP